MYYHNQYYCLTCRKYVPTRREYSAFLCVFFIVAFGWLFGFGIVIAIVYYVCSPKICAHCKSENLWQDKSGETKTPTEICQNYKALENGTCTLYRDNSCFEIKSIQNLDIFNKRGYFCPQQDEIREKVKESKKQQAHWVKTYEQKFSEPEQRPVIIPEQIKHICPYCNTTIKLEANFCTGCGSKIKKT